MHVKTYIILIVRLPSAPFCFTRGLCASSAVSHAISVVVFAVGTVDICGACTLVSIEIGAVGLGRASLVVGERAIPGAKIWIVAVLPAIVFPIVAITRPNGADRVNAAFVFAR